MLPQDNYKGIISELMIEPRCTKKCAELQEEKELIKNIIEGTSGTGTINIKKKRNGRFRFSN